MTEPRPLTGVGAELAQARQQQGLQLGEVAQQLKFMPRQIEALEAERFHDLPGFTIARGMVRNYARLLKLDPEPLLQRMSASVEAPDPNYLASRLKQPVPFSDSGRRATTQYLVLSFIALAVVAVLAFQWYREDNAPARQVAVAPAEQPAPQVPAEQPAPQLSAQQPEAAPPRQETTPAAPVAVPGPQKASESAEPPKAKAEAPMGEAPKVTPPKATTEAVPTPPLPAGMGRVAVRTEGEAWIEVRDVTGRALISSLNPAGTERAVRGRPPFQLVIGNASNVRVMYNGQPVDLKPHTKVDVARLTLQ